MDRERLTELLQDPSQVVKGDLADLRSMAERFPWFSGAHLLLAVGEHEAGDVLTNDRSLPAAFLPSRSVLFDLVRKEEPEEPSALHIVKDEDPVQGLPAVPTAAPETAPVVHPLPSIEPIKEAAPIVPHVPLEEALILPETEEVEEVPEVVEPDAENEVLDRQMVEAIRSSGYDLRHLASTVPPPVQPTSEISVTSSASPQGPELPSVVPPPAPVAAPHVERTLPGPNARLSFTDWLSQGNESQSEVASNLASAPVQIETVAILSPDEPSAAPALSQQEIMQHFIQHSSPAPATEKAVFFNPQQAAKKSLLDDGLVSETLARIHEKQGNFTKAREVYDRLAVKHPEKSVYFAALSKSLEGRTNK